MLKKLNRKQMLMYLSYLSRRLHCLERNLEYSNSITKGS